MVQSVTAKPQDRLSENDVQAIDQFAKSMHGCEGRSPGSS